MNHFTTMTCASLLAMTGLALAGLALVGCEQEPANLAPTERVMDVDDGPNPEESVIDTPAPDVDAPVLEENAVPADSFSEDDTGVQG